MMRFFTLVLCMSCFTAMNAQVYIWGGPGDTNSEFDGGLNDWTTTGSPEGAIWVWEEDGIADKGAFSTNNAAIASPSISNGAMVFDSDFYDNDGGFAAPQTGELISPVFSTVGYDDVSLTWNQHMRQYQSNFQVWVTADAGATWTTYDIAYNNDWPLNSGIRSDSKRVLDISDSAAQADEVQFKFVYTANYYFWIIDDVAVVESPDNDLATLGIYFPMQAFATPASMIQADTLDWAVEVTNIGRGENMGGTIVGEILDADGTAVHTVTQDFGAMAVNDTSFIIFDDVVLPADINMTEGVYTARYDVQTIEEDFNTTDNIDRQGLEVTSDLFDPHTSIAQANAFADVAEDWLAGSVIRTGELGTDMQYKATSVSTGGVSPGGGDVNADCYIFVFKLLNQVTDELGPIYESLETGINGDHPNLEIVGSGFSAFNAVDGFSQVAIPLEDNDGEVGVVMDQNSTYLIAQQWSTNDGIRPFTNTSTNIFYYQNSCMAYADNGNGESQWLGMGGLDIAWAIETTVITETIIATEETELAEKTVSVFPNPATSYTTVNLDFTEMTDASIIVRNSNGAFISSKAVEKATSEKVQIDLTNLPAGTYSIEVKTSKGGVAVRPFVIVK